MSIKRTNTETHPLTTFIILIFSCLSANRLGRTSEWNPGLPVTGDVGGCCPLISCEVNTVHIPQLLLTSAEATLTHNRTGRKISIFKSQVASLYPPQLANICCSELTCERVKSEA